MIKLLLIFYIPLAFTQTNLDVPLNQVAAKLKASNLEIYEGAARVYNAKQKIKFARANLLPKLNIWRLATVIVDWKSAADVITQDLVPFLVPGNWKRVKQVKILSAATNEGFHGLSKNMIFHTKLQYFQIQQDLYQYKLQKILYDSTSKALNSLEGQTQLKSEILLWYQELKFKKTSLEADLINLTQLTWEERQQLSLSLALDNNQIILPEAINSSILDEQTNNESEIQVSDDVISNSCELKEFDLILKAAPSVKKEIQWNVLGVSEISRGAGGGAFDSIPIQDGLGFGSGSSVKIHKSQVELLKKQKDGVTQTLQRQIQTIQKNRISIKELTNILEEKTSMVDQEIENAKLQMTFGSAVSPVTIIDLEQKKLIIEIERLALYFQNKVEIEKIKRLYGLEDYHLHE